MSSFFQPGLMGLGLIDTVSSCVQCGLAKTAKSPKMKPSGSGRLKIMLVAEAPGALEDQEGTQLIGKAGQRLRTDIAKLGLDFEEDLYRTNAVRCRPHASGKNRTPTNEEMLFCRDKTWKQIENKKPKAIWLFGGVAIKSFLWDWHKGEPSVAKWRGWCIPDRKRKCWILPLYHPSFLIRREKPDPALDNLFYRDLQHALECSLKPFPKFKNERKQIMVIEDSLSITTVLRQALEDNRPFIFDYETTGLKPYRTGHKIAYAGFARDGDKAWSFPFPQEGVNKELWCKILANVSIPKVAQALKFEHLWSKIILKTEVQNWLSCTQATAHVLDDRAGITSLAFQIAVRYGDFTFKDKADPYLKAPHGNDFNHVFDASPDIMLERVGLDALFEAKLFIDQQKELIEQPELKRAYDFFHEGLLTLVEAEETGIRIDENHVHTKKEELSKDHVLIKDKILDDPIILKHFKSGFNPSSDAQLRELLFNKLQLEPPFLTDKGNPKVDGEALSILAKQHDNIREVLTNLKEYRKLDDLLSTFINGLLNETWGGYLHPFFSLHLARSFRSSSQKINFQNQPERDEFSKNVVKSAFYPHPGHLLLEADYGGMEVLTSCLYHKDPALIRYVIDSTTDMHRDEAINLFCLDPNKYTPEDWSDKKQPLKKLRYIAKNQFVFPEFYGSWWDVCGTNLWGAIQDIDFYGTPMVDYLKTKGIKSARDYKELTKSEERNFWKKFKVYKAWKDKQVEEYIRTGEVILLHGFKRKGLLSRNQVINTPIQGTAFHLLLWSFIELNKIRKREKWRSKLMGQIHDSIVASVHPEEREMVISTFQRVMCEDIKKAYDWLIIPLEADFEVTDVDCSWATKKKHWV
jgi:uracil-DNA glycosylase